MPLHLLTAREVQSARDGQHADGGGVFLRVAGANANWVLRYTGPDGKRHDMGLGPAERSSQGLAGASLKGARDLAAAHRALVESDVDPLVQRREERAKRKAKERMGREQAKAQPWRSPCG